jgi:enoyl-CoA hydratase
LWGSYQTGMWQARLSMSKAKWHGLTGRPFTGREAADCELINEAVPFPQLEVRVRAIADELASIPSSQLAAMKLVLNQAYEAQGLHATQVLGPIIDGLMRNTPDALAFIERAEREGVSAVVADRDRFFRDYGQAPPERRPNPDHVIRP